MFRIVPNKSKSDGVPTPYCTMPCSGFTCQWELPATAVLLTYLYCNLLLYQSLWTKTWIEWLEYICISIFLLGVEFVVQQDQYVGGGFRWGVSHCPPPPEYWLTPTPTPIWSWWAHISKYFSINTIKKVTTCGKLFSLSTLHFRPYQGNHHRQVESLCQQVMQ